MRYIYISTVGFSEIDNFAFIIDTLEPLFSIPFKMGKPIELPQYAFDPLRQQYYAAPILRVLMDSFSADGLKIVGVTDVDLCTPIFNYIFGHAQLGGRVAIVSTHRLNPKFYQLPEDKELLTERLIKTLVHELCHCFGLIHCDDPNCVMFLADNIYALDNKENLCLECSYFLKEQLMKENL